MGVDTEYYGKVDIEYWEYSLMFFYLFGLYLYFARQKNLRIKREPEYRYFLWGLYAKILGGIFFSLIYFYYYKGGDTISYFYSALPLVKLAGVNVGDFFHVLFGANSVENRQYFTLETGLPYNYVYSDDRTYMVIRLITPILFVAFESYLITTVIVAGISYIGIWRCYQTFVRYFPRLQGWLAVAFLFMPSCIFWGSSILKDTFTFSAVCWYLHSFDNIFFRRRQRAFSLLAILVATFLIVSIKPYIFMSLFPLSLLWLFYGRLARLRNVLVKYVLLPAGFLAMVGLSFLVLSSLGDKLGKFSMENALDTIMVTQHDLKRAEEYGSNYFDIGPLEATWGSVLSKFPVATNAALFRPYLWECRNVVMVLAGLENLFMLWITLVLLMKSRVLLIPTMISKNPIALLCILFALFYGFITGITTPNFGALVRFKIPLLPLYVAGVRIMIFMLEERRLAIIRGTRFRFDDYAQGDPHVKHAAEAVRRR